MEYDKVTLNHLFREQKWHEENLAIPELQQKMSDIKKEIQKKEPTLKWEEVLGEIKDTCTNLLNIKLSDVLKGAWGKYKEIEQYLDEEKYKTDETFLIPLVNHTITSIHHPKVEIRLGEVYISKIEFDVNLKLYLTGVILKINQGKIKGVKGGKCKSKGTFSCEGITLFEDESTEFEF